MKYVKLVGPADKGICGCDYISPKVNDTDHRVRYIDGEGNEYCYHCIRRVRETVNIVDKFDSDIEADRIREGFRSVAARLGIQN